MPEDLDDGETIEIEDSPKKGKDPCRCPHTPICIAIFVVTEPGARPHKQFARLTKSRQDTALEAQMSKMIYWTNSLYHQICVDLQICGIYRLDPRKARGPGGGKHTLFEYRHKGKYEAHKRINGHEFLYAASKIVDKAKLFCPLKNSSCLKLFVVNRLSADGVGQHETGGCVPISEAKRPGIPGQIPAHEIGHDLFGVVRGKTDANGHVVGNRFNVMSAEVGFAGRGLSPWQKKRAMSEIARRGLDVPGGKAMMVKECRELTKQIRALTQTIARAKLAAKKAKAAARKAAERKRKSRKPSRYRKRKKRTLDQRIALYKRRVANYTRNRDAPANWRYKTTWEGMRKRAAAELAKLKKKKAAMGPSSAGPAATTGKPAPPKADSDLKNFDVDKAERRLHELTLRLNRYRCCRDNE